MTGVTEEEDAPAAAFSEPSLNSLVESAISNSLGEGALDGWRGLDNQTLGQTLDKQRREQTLRLKKEANLFRDVFLLNPDGRRVLELLLDATLRRTAWPVHAMTSMEMLTAFGIWREAENSFVAGLIEAIAVAENAQPKRRSDP